MRRFLFILQLIFLLVYMGSTHAATKQMEYLNRGTVAVKTNNGVFLSWRFLGNESANTSFNIYRDGVKINSTPISEKTNFLDKEGTTNSRYAISAVVDGGEKKASSPVSVWSEQYKTLSLRRPNGGSNASGSYTYTPNDMSVGDVDGDGEYELFVKWDPSNSQDNSKSGYTGNVFIDCYKMNGTFLWRIDLGINIRAGAHYTQFQVFDFDGDGKAEMVCKTAPGSKDGNGKYILMNQDNPTDDYRNSGGYVLSGPEYLTIFDGQTGAEIHTVAYNPGRGNVSNKSTWGDNYGNRCDRFLACTAYLDGVHPSIVMCRGYYTQSNLVAYDYKNGKLVQRWEHFSRTANQGAYGEGFHNLAVADVDNDGYDEIIYGSACIDHNGQLLYRTGFGHGDAMHVSDLDPTRPGLEGWFVHEEADAKYSFELRDLKTGQALFGIPGTGKDNGRGLAADIDGSHQGFECWSLRGDGTYDCKGKVISSIKPSVNFRIYWDGDLQDELLDGTSITKWNGNGINELITLKGSSINGTKANPCLSADIFGDWREEVITFNNQDPSQIFIYTTTIESEYRLFTPMHDAVYRCAVAWQNTAYNQPPHLGFYIGDGVKNIQQPDIYVVGEPKDPTEATLSTTGDLSQELFVGEKMNTVTFTWDGAATGADISFSDKFPINNVTQNGNVITIRGSFEESCSLTITTKGGENVVEKSLNIQIVGQGKKKVAYITDPNDATYKNDIILPMLRECEELYIRELNAQNSNYDYSAYDLVVVSEVTPSTAPIMASLKGIDKPMLSMKIHAYKNATGAWAWANNGYGDNMTGTNITVNDEQKEHPMFKDVTFINGNEVQMVSSVLTKALTYMNPESFIDASGEITSIANISGENQTCILEIGTGSVIAGTLLTENFIQIGLNSSSYANLTDDGLSIVKNACYYLLGINQTNDATDCDNVFISKKELTIAPNPTSDFAIISFYSTEEKEATIMLYSLNGTLISGKRVKLVTGTNNIKYDCHNLPFGEYYIMLEKEVGKLLVR